VTWGNRPGKRIDEGEDKRKLTKPGQSIATLLICSNMVIVTFLVLLMLFYRDMMNLFIITYAVVISIPAFLSLINLIFLIFTGTFGSIQLQTPL
jgi:hypothetical protein